MTGLTLERRGAVAVVGLDRPSHRNAFDAALAERFEALVTRLGADPGVRAVVLTSTGPTFASGGDLHQLEAWLGEPRGGALVRGMGDRLAAVESVPVPVLAAVNGDVLGGGCELVLACDAVFVERQASLQFRHVHMGLTPAWGTVSRLVARVGQPRAADLLLSGRAVPAAEAVALGLALELCEPGAALDAALAYAARVEGASREAVGAMKRVVRKVERSLRAAALPHEAEAFDAAFGGPDHRAAMARFRARRR